MWKIYFRHISIHHFSTATWCIYWLWAPCQNRKITKNEGFGKYHFGTSKPVKKWCGLYTMVITNMEQTRTSILIEVGSGSIWSIVFSNIYKSTKINIASDENREIGTFQTTGYKKKSIIFKKKIDTKGILIHIN